MQKTVGLFILEILPFVLDCKLSFFLLRPFTGRTENVCISSVTVQKENHHLCIASKRENEKEKSPLNSMCRLQTFRSQTRGSGLRIGVFQWHKQLAHTHKDECNYYSSCWSLPSLSISLFFVWIYLKEKKTFCNDYLQFKNQ